MKTCKKFLVLSIIIFLSATYMSGQTPDSSGVYSFATTMPSYRGGEDALLDFIHQNIKYPKDAWEQKKEGAVQIRAVIDEQGNVSQTRVVRGICPSLDEEAQRVIKSTSGMWLCGKVNEKPVRTYKYVKINFKIDTTSDQSAAIAKPVQPISFIGGDEAFYNFIRTNIEVPVAVYLHPDLWGNVRASMTFNSLNEITDVTLIEGPFKDLNEEGVRLLKLSHGKWLRTDSSKMSGPVSIIVDIPFNQTMVDTNNRNKIFTDRFVHIAYVSNPVFKRGFDNFQSGNYDMAIQDFEECIHKKENLEAGLYGRALCYLRKHNLAAACEDLSVLKSDNPDKGNYFVEMYYKYCSQPDRSNQKLRTPSKPQNLKPILK